MDQILSHTPIPCDFDLLSIDIDGNDYHVWQAMSQYTPKTLVIEFNPTIPTHIRFVQPADPSINQGASLLSLVELAREKDYELVSVLPCNAFFVRRKYYPLFQIESNNPEVLRTNLEQITYLFSGFDGQIFLRGNCTLPWHNLGLTESMVQPLPKFLRRYPDDYSFWQKLGFRIFRLVATPNGIIKAIRRRLDRVSARRN